MLTIVLSRFAGAGVGVLGCFGSGGVGGLGGDGGNGGNGGGGVDCFGGVDCLGGAVSREGVAIVSVAGDFLAGTSRSGGSLSCGSLWADLLLALSALLEDP